jgi:adenylate cyclase
MERRLAAIMATDLVGNSRLIRTDEEGMLAALMDNIPRFIIVGD